MEGFGQLSTEQIKDYAASTEKIANAVESLMRHDGWGIFMALLNREFSAIKEKRDYKTLADFQADREAIDIMERLLDTFKGYVEDAHSMQSLLVSMSDQPPQDRGILLIEASEGAIVEG